MSPVTISPAAFSLAAAHGLTDRVAATWSPDLPRDPRVMVPVEVEALVLRKGGGAWAETRMQSPPASPDGSDDADDDAVLHSTLLAPPFAELSADDVKARRAPGAYLHWALPAALTRGVQSADAAPATPPMPPPPPPAPPPRLPRRLPPRSSPPSPTAG